MVARVKGGGVETLPSPLPLDTGQLNYFRLAPSPLAAGQPPIISASLFCFNGRVKVLACAANLMVNGSVFELL